MRRWLGLVLVLTLGGCPAEPAPPPPPPAPAPSAPEPAPAPEPEPAPPPPPAPEPAPATPSFDPMNTLMSNADLGLGDEVKIEEVDPTIGRPVDRSNRPPPPPPSPTTTTPAGTPPAGTPRPPAARSLEDRVAGLVAGLPMANEIDLPRFERFTGELAREVEAERQAGTLTLEGGVAAYVSVLQLGTVLTGIGRMQNAQLEPGTKIAAEPLRRAFEARQLDPAEFKRRCLEEQKKFEDALRERQRSQQQR